METLEDILVSLGVVVALPVLIMAIIFKSVMAADRNRKEIILAALEKNPNLNVEDLVKRMNKSEKLIKEKLLAKLQRGCLCCLMGVALVLLYFFPSVHNEFLIIAGAALIAVGIAFLVSYFVGRRMLEKEILAEEQSMNKE